MYFTPHKTASCPNCQSDDVRYATKEEVSGFKVYYACEACSREWMTGKVMKADIESTDAMYEQAERMAP